LDWDEGPDLGGPHAPYDQSARMPLYREALERLRAGGYLYACTCSRKDIRLAASAPHPPDDEPVYPGTCRERKTPPVDRPYAWRFRVPEGRRVRFTDGRRGDCVYEAGRDFGDFVVWRSDDTPAYHLACVVDDALMGITEVVRGEDLLRSTARQLLLYEAMGWPPPAWFHCELVTDEHGRRLAKRHDALSLRALRERGADPAAWVKEWSERLRDGEAASRRAPGAAG
ncbi:MAG: tRNA glutamyl-Q synthetase, partial [Verrucomicrobia bacterium]